MRTDGRRTEKKDAAAGLVRGLLVMTDAQSLSPAAQMTCDGADSDVVLAGLSASVYGTPQDEAVAAKEVKQVKRDSLEEYNTYRGFMRSASEILITINAGKDTPYNGIELGERTIVHGAFSAAKRHAMPEEWTKLSLVVMAAADLSEMPLETVIQITDSNILATIDQLQKPTLRATSVAYGSADDVATPKYTVDFIWAADGTKSILLTLDPDWFTEQAKQTRNTRSNAHSKPGTYVASLQLDFERTRAAPATAVPIVVLPSTNLTWGRNVSRALPTATVFYLQSNVTGQVRNLEDNKGPLLAVINAIILGVFVFVVFATFSWGVGIPYACEMGIRARLVNSYVKGEIAEPVVQPLSPVLTSNPGPSLTTNVPPTKPSAGASLPVTSKPPVLNVTK